MNSCIVKGIVDTESNVNQQKTCKICLGSEPPYLFPCLCSSIIHEQCFIKWILHTNNHYPNKIEEKVGSQWKVKCQICKSMINAEFQSCFTWTSQFTYYLILFMTPLLLLFSVIIVLLCICINGEEEEWKFMMPLIIFLFLLFIGGVYFFIKKLRLFMSNINNNKVTGVKIRSKT